MANGGASSTGGQGQGGNGFGGGAGGLGTTQCTPGASLAPARLMLITDNQYRNIMRDAFGVTFPLDMNVTSPPGTSGNYTFNENGQVQATTLQAYGRAADEVAKLLTSFSTCAAGAVDATCMEKFLRDKLPLAWRRPVTDVEISGLIAIFNSGAPDGKPRQIQLTLEAALLHPALLYRSEIGTNAATTVGKVALTPYELASAVSFALLGSVPDPDLWAKAADGTLTDAKVLSDQVARLVALPAARANLKSKVSYFLDFEALSYVQKDATEFPPFAALRPTLYQSSQKFLEDILWQGHFADLFTSRRIYANEAMAKEYGLPPVVGMELQPVTTTGDQYNGGVLTQPALLAASNRNASGDDVIHRGLWVYYNLLCAPTLPAPPANATTVAETMTGSTRQIAISRGTTCGLGCHGRFDAFGLATLGYDGIGRFRTTDPTSTPPGGALDTSASVAAGVLEGHADMPAMLGGVADVAKEFASGRQVSDCAAVNLATYIIEHNPDDGKGTCELQAIKDRFKTSGSFTDLFSAIITSSAFLTRDAE
jgi:Protein of unknown function (DUF1592)/Protein of unknown function (DUF1588)/Protein of unknown function (DUF1595)